MNIIHHFQGNKIDTIFLMKMADQYTSIHSLTCPVPWNLEQFQESLAQPIVHCLNIMDYDRLIGFIMFRIIADEADILTFCIDPSYQHKGYGRRLLQAMLSLCNKQNVAQCFLEVETNNQKAIALYKSLGFCIQQVRPNFYTKPGHKKLLPAFLMSYTLGKKCL